MSELAVGDWVEITPEFIDEQNKNAAIIKQILPRRTKLARASNKGEQIIASNIDSVFIVTSINHDLNINRLQRYCLLVNESGAEPVIVLSKIDLNSNYLEIANNIKQNLGIEVLCTSITDSIGINELLKLTPLGSTSVFIGSSGVGKSSLVNHLLNKAIQSTQEIREDDSKGRHTTTSRALFQIPNHGLIIDTPGVREVSVLGSSESLNETFPLIKELTIQCKFNDCQHQTEPGGAILNALDEGKLSAKEWENYKKLQAELLHSKRKSSKAEQSNSKKRWKSINIAQRKYKKIKK